MRPGLEAASAPGGMEYSVCLFLVAPRVSWEDVQLADLVYRSSDGIHDFDLVRIQSFDAKTRDWRSKNRRDMEKVPRNPEIPQPTTPRGEPMHDSLADHSEKCSEYQKKYSFLFPNLACYATQR